MLLLAAGDRAGQWRVNCSNPSGGAWNAGSFTFSVTAEAGQDDCKNQTTVQERAQLPGCCATGTDSAYAFGRGWDATDNTIPFGNGTCFNKITEMSCGTSSNNWGWRNEFPAEGNGTFSIYAGAAVGCKNSNKMVGTITVACKDYLDSTDSTKNGSRVTVYMPDQALVDGASLSLLDHHLYVGCKEWAPLVTTTTTYNTRLKKWVTTTSASLDSSPSCTPPAFGAPKDSLTAVTKDDVTSGAAKCWSATDDAKISSAPKGRCGGNCYHMLVPIGESSVGMFVPGCSCSGLYWVYHQSSKSDARYTYNPTEGICPVE